jgi:transposase
MLLEPAMAIPRPTRQDPKAEALARDGVLNPHPEGVRDPLFNANPFFDPKDLVQVRYEMVRRHQNDGIAISDVAETFGVSRPTFYKAQGALADQGLAGLVPRQRGPKGGHKISAEVLSFAEAVKAATPELTLPQLIGMIAERFGRNVHRRSLERALARKKNSAPLPHRGWRRDHQRLRAVARRSAWRRTDRRLRIGHHAA